MAITISSFCMRRVTEDIAGNLAGWLKSKYLRDSDMRFEVRANLLLLLPGLPWTPGMWIPWGFGIFLVGSCPDNLTEIEGYIDSEESCTNIVSEEEARRLYNAGKRIEAVTLLGLIREPWTPGKFVPYPHVLVLCRKCGDVETKNMLYRMRDRI